MNSQLDSELPPPRGLMLLIMTLKRPTPTPATLVPKYWDQEGNEQKQKDPSADLPEAEFYHASRICSKIKGPLGRRQQWTSSLDGTRKLRNP